MCGNVLKKINDDVTIERENNGLVTINVKGTKYQRQPLHDRLFKYLFKSNGKKGKQLALNMINDLLLREGSDRYVDLQYSDTEIPAQGPNAKNSIVDFLAKTSYGDWVHIEVQLRHREYLVDRVIHYWHKISAEKGAPEKGQSYSDCSRVISILLTDNDVYLDEDYFRSLFLLPVKHDLKAHENILPTDPSIIDLVEKYGYISIFEMNKFHKYMLKLSREHTEDKSYIKALDRINQWLVYFSSKSTSEELGVLSKDEYFMPMFQLENEYYNKYSSEPEYFQVIGTVTDEEYISMIERDKQKLEQKLVEEKEERKKDRQKHEKERQDYEKERQEHEKERQEHEKEREGYIINVFKRFRSVDEVADMLSLSKEYVKKVLLSRGLISLGS